MSASGEAPAANSPIVGAGVATVALSGSQRVELLPRRPLRESSVAIDALKDFRGADNREDLADLVRGRACLLLELLRYEMSVDPLAKSVVLRLEKFREHALTCLAVVLAAFRLSARHRSRWWLSPRHRSPRRWR